MTKTINQVPASPTKIAKGALSFGLASIDSLIDPYSLAYQVDDASPLVGCIVGPDGVGKSILGLTAASVYASSNYKSTDVRVIYASTDLNIVQAESSWRHFGLDLPKKRRSQILEKIEQLYFDVDDISALKTRDMALADSCDLQWLSPFPSVSVRTKRKSTDGSGRSFSPVSFDTIFVEREQKEKKAIVEFLDLAEFSAGDDWGLLNRIIGLLECRFPKRHVPHLLVIDAVEGLETMAGNVDAFGLRRSRRSRLAQLVRIARKARCSILFVIEQKSPEIKLDEVFISDLVLRLNVMERDGYLQKSIEIEKARSVSHVRGIHEFQIRDGRGGSGDSYVPDDPRITMEKDGRSRYLGYMQVWPSLHQKAKLDSDVGNEQRSGSLSSESDAHSKNTDDRRVFENDEVLVPNLVENAFLESTDDIPPDSNSIAIPTRPSWFGIQKLDDLISQSRRSNGSSSQGRIVVSVGEAGTLKSRLAYAFLSEAFRDDDAKANIFGGSILITSEGMNAKALKSAFLAWGAKPTNYAEQVLVRPIQPRFLSSSGFLFRLKLCIRHMKRSLRQLAGQESSPSKIRLVIDNWNTILESHPALSQDPQILQRVFQLLREEDVLAHIVGTQPGSPSALSALGRAHNIGQLEAIHLHTWPVDFFGDRRIAISSSLPGSGDRRTAIYELARDEKSNCDYRVKILSDFELYEDLESGKAKRVDLRVKLYSGFHADNDVPHASTASYSHEVSALFGDLFPNSKNGRDVVSFESIERYDAFKEYIQNMETSKLDETLVFQVDEFWNGDSECGTTLASLSDYFDAIPKWHSRPRRDWFSDGIPTGEAKVPLHKDFGLLLADRSAWWRAKDCKIDGYDMFKCSGLVLPKHFSGGLDYSSMQVPRTGHDFDFDIPHTFPADQIEALYVCDVWNALCVPGNELPRGNELPSLDSSFQSRLSPSWEMFLAACRVVANQCGKMPFDIDVRTSESLSSLVLEIWLTKVRDQLYINSRNPKNQPPWKKPSATELQKATESLAEIFAIQSKETYAFTLPCLVKEWLSELDYAIRLVVGYLPSRFRNYDLPLSSVDENAIAFRTWFAPAVLCQKENEKLAPLRLPGKFSVRGDWHIGVANGSRSLLLAQTAIDKLVSDSMNRKRLRDGVGLPVINTPGIERVESALTVPMNETARKRLRYGEVCCLEPTPSQSTSHLEAPLQRIFRSRISRYDHHSSEFFLLLTELLRTIEPLPSNAIVKASEPNIGLSEYMLHEHPAVAALYRQFSDRSWE